ncbi:ATP synthase F0 subunit B [Desulfococcaceae bacterium OttesenSCG-928-F15]|nr:ATP synthase F0 subunit B [Desulfococcaceae bacterium OttesenSCG-928-F15]
MKKQGMLFAWGVLIFFLFVDSAFAASDNVWKTTDTYRVMCFVVLVVALYFPLRKPVARFLNSRIDQIKEDLEILELKKKEAEAALAECRRQFEEMDKEALKIQEEYKKQGEAARELIIRDAEIAAAKMKEQARNNLEEEFLRAKKKLQAEIMELALDKAESMIIAGIQPEDHERLAEEYIKKVVNS